MNDIQDRVLQVLKRMIEQVKEDEQYAEVYALSLDSELDYLHSDDFFGSEGQSDPRGDFRDGMYSCQYRVQGVDT